VGSIPTLAIRFPASWRLRRPT